MQGRFLIATDLSHDYTNVQAIPPADFGQKKWATPGFPELFSNVGEHWRLFVEFAILASPSELACHSRTKKAFQRQETKVYTFSYMIGTVYFYALNTRLCVNQHKFGTLSRPATRPIRRFYAVLVTQWSDREVQG